MGRLIYTAIASLDGYVADTAGRFDWSMPDEEVHAFVNQRQRRCTTHLYGRRLYEVLVAWDDPAMLDSPAPELREFAEIWREAAKVVYSRTLSEVTTTRTRLERDFDRDRVERLVAGASGDVLIGGPELAGLALGAGLVSEVHLLLSPVVVGGGTPVLREGLRVDLRLLEQRRFGNGVVHLGYAVR